MFHKHKWKLLETNTFENELPKMHGCKFGGHLAEELGKRGIVSVVQCEECGKIEHIKTVF